MPPQSAAVADDVLTIRSFSAFVNAQPRGESPTLTRLLAQIFPIGRDSPLGLRSAADVVLRQTAASAVDLPRLRAPQMPPASVADAPPLQSAISATVRQAAGPLLTPQQQTIARLFPPPTQADAIPLVSAAQVVLRQALQRAADQTRALPRPMPPPTVVSSVDDPPLRSALQTTARQVAASTPDLTRLATRLPWLYDTMAAAIFTADSLQRLGATVEQVDLALLAGVPVADVLRNLMGGPGRLDGEAAAGRLDGDAAVGALIGEPVAHVLAGVAHPLVLDATPAPSGLIGGGAKPGRLG
jgi:hypothetical protein